MKPLYRIWDTVKKCYCPNYLDAMCVKQDGEIIQLMMFIDDEPAGDYPDCVDQDVYIVERCTGIKDHKDQWIFEGDVIEKYISIDGIINGVVKYIAPSFQITYSNTGKEHAWDGSRMTVVGNIHENSKETKDES